MDSQEKLTCLVIYTTAFNDSRKRHIIRQIEQNIWNRADFKSILKILYKSKGNRMSTVNIAAIASALPEQLVLSSDIINQFNGSISNNVADMLEMMSIDQRYSVVEDYAKYISGKNERKLIENINQFAVRSIEKCLNSFQGDADICLVIAITNTASRPLPCMAYELLALAGEALIPRHVNVINMQNQGCSTMVKAIDLARCYLTVHHNKHVLITMAEAHTAMVPPVSKKVMSFSEIADLDNLQDKSDATLQLNRLINGYLFGDGAVSILLTNNDSKSTFKSQHLTNISSHDTDILYMNEGGSCIPDYPGFPQYYLTKNVPKRGVVYIQSLLKKMLKDLTKEEFIESMDLILIHTGSKKIIDLVIRLLKLEDQREKIGISYDIIKQYGNLSSCSLGFMLEKAVLDKKSGHFLLVSFGVGFSGSLAAWHC